MVRLKSSDLKDFLDGKVKLYNSPLFIKSDPVSIPHRFQKKEDIEIAGFLTASIAWGKRSIILDNASNLLHRMDNAPFDFITNFSKNDCSDFKNFVHRTFNGIDCIFFLNALKKIYKEKKTLEYFFVHFSEKQNNSDYKEAINGLREFFFSIPHPSRTQKHFANPFAGSAAKRINMFLRWMIRNDANGVDFGLWNLNPALLTCPLDVHSGRVARKLGLLKRNQNDWKAAAELTLNLKKFDSSDPVKYDFALFGLGVFENF